jgi:hypothetical protein
MKLFTTIREMLGSFRGVTVKSVKPDLKPLSQPLIPVTPGEWFDRVTILEIKVGKTKGDKQAAAMSQLTALRESPRGQQLQYLRLTEPPLKQAVGQLLSTNSQLWDVEDAIRSMDDEIFAGNEQNLLYDHIDRGRHDDSPSLSKKLVVYLNLARSVYITNDERSRWKREIDKFFEVQPEVKEYATYGQATETSPKR